jgi:O-antigen/teichoic acid export membrane protein
MTWMLFISFVSLAFLRWMDQDLGISVFWWLALLLSFNAANTNRYMLLALKKITFDNQLGIAFGAVQLLLFALLWFMGEPGRIMLFVKLLTMANVALLLASSWAVYRFWPKTSVAQTSGLFRAMFGVGGWSQLANVLQFMSYRLSYYLIEDRLGMAAVGVFGVAVSLAESLWIISRAVSLVQMSEVANSNDLQRAKQITVNWFKATALFTLGAIVVLLAIPEPWLVFVFEKDFTGIRPLLWGLAPGILFLSVSNILTHYFAGIGYYRFNALVSFFTLIGLLLALPLLSNYAGLTGAAWAQSVAYGGGLLLAMLLFAGRKTGIWLALFPGKADWKFLQSVVSSKNKA